MRTDDVRAIAVSDLHISASPPLARETEVDWFAAMARPLQQVTKLQEKYNVPVLCAGDIFDRWQSSVELTNFAIAYCPHMYAVPGNHDLPYHNFSELRKSPFWTLMRAKRIELLLPNNPIAVGDLVLHGFPHGHEVKPNQKPQTLALDIAVVHAMIWTKKSGFKNAPDDCRLKSYKSRLKGYNVAVFGDNHIPFNAKFTYDDETTCSVHNCGSLMRRNVTQINYQPSVGLIHSDASVTRLSLDCSEDKFVSKTKLDKLLKAEAKAIDVEGFISELKEVKDNAFDFIESVKSWIRDNKPSSEVRQMILESVEGVK